MLKHKEKKYTVHHGKILKEAIQKSGFTIRHVANKIDKEYSTVFKWFSKKEIDIGNFIKVGKVINHNFAGEIEGLATQVTDDEIPYSRLELSQCVKECDRLRLRYIELLERHNALLEKIAVAAN